MTAHQFAQRYIGLTEVAGISSNAQILEMLQLDEKWPKDDEVPWCSAFLNFVAWHLNLPRSKSLKARSWLTVGEEVNLESAKVGNDIVILSRGSGIQPGPAILNASGHVGLFSGMAGDILLLLGGNQNNQVSIAPYPISRLLGIRRLVKSTL